MMRPQLFSVIAFAALAFADHANAEPISINCKFSGAPQSFRLDISQDNILEDGKSIVGLGVAKEKLDKTSIGVGDDFLYFEKTTWNAFRIAYVIKRSTGSLTSLTFGINDKIVTHQDAGVCRQAETAANKF